MAITGPLAAYILLLSLMAVAALSPRQDSQDGAIVYERFHIQSIIVARYAITSITSVALNSATVSKELSFQVQLPDTAFISNFSMVVNGSTFVGIADEKARAEREFEQRQQAGENVGLVESRGTNLFRIRINTAAQSRTTFVLEYEELLDRRLSKYQQTINLNPGSIVTDFRVDVQAVDEQGIVSFSASDFVSATRISGQEVMYEYTPRISDQNDQVFGLARDMIVEYDVNHPATGAGLIVVNDCYFAQFFSPSGITPIPVDIVFVIDVSGSMEGTKIDQARESLEEVISQLRVVDRFSIVTFESDVSVWRNELVSVRDFRESGIQFAQGLRAGGGTNFVGGMQEGIDILKEHGNGEFIQLLVMLTDGQPTAGITTNENEIVHIASRELVGTTISLNTLGFGLNLNFQLLVRLALENRGIAQRIYEGEDAAEQLEGFYQEISSPILQGVTVTYPPNTIEVSSELEFPLLFDGSEIVVAGKFVDDLCLSSVPIPVSVSGTGASEPRLFQGQVTPANDTEIAGFRPSTERLVAYLTIQQTLDRLAITEDKVASARLNASALAMSLRYNFVTPLTSLIVVQTSMDNSTSNSTTGEDGDDDNGQEEDGGFAGGNLIPTSGGGVGASGDVQSLAFRSSSSVSVVALAVSIPIASLLLLSTIAVTVIVATLYVRRRKKRGSPVKLESYKEMMRPLTESTDGKGTGLDLSGEGINMASPPTESTDSKGVGLELAGQEGKTIPGTGLDLSGDINTAPPHLPWSTDSEETEVDISSELKMLSPPEENTDSKETGGTAKT